MYYMVIKLASPNNLGVFDEIYIIFATLKVEAPNHDIFGDLPFD